MYLPNYFHENDSAAINDLIVNNHFATLIVLVDGAIEVTHIPLYLDNDNNCLLGHVARANLFAKELVKTRQLNVKVIFNGEHGYISNSYYLEPSKQVPTWNYAKVHIDGIMGLIDSKDEIIQILDLQFGVYETSSLNWDLDYLNKLINGIVAIKIDIKQITAKFKLSQNRSEEDIQSVIEHLIASTDDKQISLGKYMQRYYNNK